MMAHVEDAIERYFEGRVGRIEERDALFGHLDRCDTCRNRFDELATVHRSLAEVHLKAPAAGMPQSELALIRGTVISGVAQSPGAPERRIAAYLAMILAPVAVVAVAVVVLPSLFPGALPGSEVDVVAKGGETSAVSSGTHAIEVLCFDEKAEVVRAHLVKDGTCPAPGYVKLMYAAPRSVPRLFVAAIAGEEVRLSQEIAGPEPRSVIAGHAELHPGDRMRIVAASGEERISPERARALAPILTVTGVAR